MLTRLRKRSVSESGFSLIELLVVMLILGILAAIAIPAFLNQKNKATDAQAKTNARTLQTAMEACGSDNRGSYASCGITPLRAIEKSLPQSGSSVTATPDTPAGGYTVSALSDSGNSFTIGRDNAGAITHTCSVPSGKDRGGCPTGGSW
jgi:type IV pilus assembly protein PilA